MHVRIYNITEFHGKLSFMFTSLLDRTLRIHTYANTRCVRNQCHSLNSVIQHCPLHCHHEIFRHFLLQPVPVNMGIKRINRLINTQMKMIPNENKITLNEWYGLCRDFTLSVYEFTFSLVNILTQWWQIQYVNTILQFWSTSANQITSHLILFHNATNIPDAAPTTSQAD